MIIDSGQGYSTNGPDPDFLMVDSGAFQHDT